MADPVSLDDIRADDRLLDEVSRQRIDKHANDTKDD